MLSDMMTAKHKALLMNLKTYLDDNKIPSELFEANDVIPISFLSSALLVDYKERSLLLHINFLPLSEEDGITVEYIQFLTSMPFEVKEAYISELNKVINVVNENIAVGHLFIRNNKELCFKYMYVMPGGQTIDKEIFSNIFTMISLTLEDMMKSLEDTALGNVTAEKVLGDILK